MAMGKKKRQSDHSMTGDSSDSNEENEGKPNSKNCVHVSKAIAAVAVRKLIKEDSWPPECSDCKRKNKDKLMNGETKEKDDNKETIYVCLRCGVARCGDELQHAQSHSKNRQSEVHDVALNPVDWTVWCFECNSEIPVNSTKQLSDTVEYIKKRTSKMNKDKVPSNTSTVNIGETTYTGSFVLASVPVISTPSNDLPKVRGLANLGNTCFMNAVLQCLAHTPFLLDVLEEMHEPGEKFRLPGGEIQIGEEKEILDPLEGTLGGWGPLTAALADTLRELKCGDSTVFVPNRVRSQLHEKCPQFRGYGEHDSHELLRQLLDTVRTEDLQRYQKAILEQLGLERKSEREQVSDQLRRTIKGYGCQIGELPLRPSKVFRGELVSTLVCQRCQHATEHVEHFLDLSLPVAADKPVHIRRRQSDDHDTPSKHQIRKERKAARKAGWSRSKYSAPGQTALSPDNENASENSDGESDRDAEDEAEPEVSQSKALVHVPGKVNQRLINLAEVNDDLKTTDSTGNLGAVRIESCVDSASVDIDENQGTEGSVDGSLPELIEYSDNKSPTSEGDQDENSLLVANSEASEPSERIQDQSGTKQKTLALASDLDTNQPDLTESEGGGDPALPEQRDIVESGYSSEKPGTGDSVCGSPSSEQPHSNALRSDMSDLHVHNDPDALGALAAESDSDGGDEPCAGATLGQRAYTTTGECTLITCLNQFTAKELLTGNNKVGCDACSERAHGKGGKTIYTDASKQLLILSPPAILILHLKRFQVLRLTSRKNSEEVKFPLVLDLAPFCLAKCRNTSTVRKDQKEIRYSLYGVVQHSGNMHGGHYVAYVKVRPNVPRDSPRWQFLPGGNPSLEEDSPPEPPPGQWYYVSDSHSRETSAAQVIDSEAYVLFYERIW